MNEKQRIGLIYRVTSPSGKCYIGQTVYSLTKRKREHTNSANNPNSRVYNTKFSKAIRKYGDNLEWEVVERFEECLLNEAETKFINLNNAYIDGYNSTPTGTGKGKRLSKSTRLKLSKANKGKKLLPETKKKISNSLKGKMAGDKNPMFGKKQPKEQIAKKSKVWIFIGPNLEIYDNIVNMRKFCRDNGLKQSHMINTARPNSGTGFYKRWKAYPYSEWTCQEALEDYKKLLSKLHPTYILKSPEGKIYKTDKITNFCKEYDLSCASITKVANPDNNRRQHKGWLAWKEEDFNNMEKI